VRRSRSRARCATCTSPSTPRTYFDLDEPIVNVIRVELPSKARALYRDMEKRMFMELGEHDVEAFNAAARTIKCLQLANGAAYVGDSTTNGWRSTMPRFKRFKASPRKRWARPSWWPTISRATWPGYKERSLTVGCWTLTLNTIREWNAVKYDCSLLILRRRGTASTFRTAATSSYSSATGGALEEYQQIIERIGPVRQKQAGHDRPVFIHHIVAADTVDEMVMARRETKRAVQDLLLDAMKVRG
jgi:hypothetical protein